MLATDLTLVVCGTAAGKHSGQLNQYDAGSCLGAGYSSIAAIGPRLEMGTPALLD